MQPCDIHCAGRYSTIIMMSKLLRQQRACPASNLKFIRIPDGIRSECFKSVATLFLYIYLLWTSPLYYIHCPDTQVVIQALTHSARINLSRSSYGLYSSSIHQSLYRSLRLVS